MSCKSPKLVGTPRRSFGTASGCSNHSPIGPSPWHFEASRCSGTVRKFILLRQSCRSFSGIHLWPMRLAQILLSPGDKPATEFGSSGREERSTARPACSDWGEADKSQRPSCLLIQKRIWKQLLEARVRSLGPIEILGLLWLVNFPCLPSLRVRAVYRFEAWNYSRFRTICLDASSPIRGVAWAAHSGQ